MRGGCMDCKAKFRIPKAPPFGRCPACGSSKIIDYNLEPVSPGINIGLMLRQAGMMVEQIEGLRMLNALVQTGLGELALKHKVGFFSAHDEGLSFWLSIQGADKWLVKVTGGTKDDRKEITRRAGQMLGLLPNVALNA